MPYVNLRNGLICKAMNFLWQCTLVVVLIFAASTNAFAQGPSPSYFHDLGSQIPWAECAAYQPGGSSQKAGTQGYSRDVQFDSHLVFIGEGVAETESDTDSVPDLGGSVALMALQPTSSATFEERVMMLARKGAVAVAVFPKDKRVFYPVLKPELMKEFEDLVPVIGLSHDTARRLFEAHSPLGEQDLQRWMEGGEAPRLGRMVPRLRCYFEGRFRRLESTPS
jgi:hypothetical protein